MFHLNNKQNKNTNPSISRQDYHLTQPCPSEEKQTNKKTQHKSHPFWSLHKPLEGRNEKEERIQPWSLGKEDLKHNKLKKKIMRRQRNTTQMKEQTRNTEVQINEEEIRKLPGKEFRMRIVKWSKTLKTKWRKCKNQLTKT